MDNKYNKLMDHIEVTDEMRARILQNISDMNIEPARRNVTPISSAKRAKVSRIIGIVAAAGIVLTVGGVFLIKSAGAKQKSSDTAYNVRGITGIDSYENAASDDIYHYGSDTLDTTVAGIDDGTKSQTDAESAGEDPRYLAPEMNGMTSGSSTIINRISYVDENGKDHIVSDPSSIAKLLSLVDGTNYKNVKTDADHIKLTLLGGNNQFTVTISGVNKDKALEIILNNSISSDR